MTNPALDRFQEVVAIVRRDFPKLTVKVDRDDPYVDAAAEIPAQEGLPFDVSFNLQNSDELHLSVGGFWKEWVPCHRQDVVDAFVEALVGILSGRFRVVESHLLGQPVVSRLQRPTGAGKWQTIGWTANQWALVPWRRTKRIVQNR